MITRHDQHMSKEAYEQHKQAFMPFIMNNIDIKPFEDVSELQSSSVIVDVSCSHSTEFNGNPTHREQVNLKLSDFICAYQSLRANQDHWILKSGLNLYLSQCCVYAADASSIQIASPHVCQSLPSCLQEETIDAVNVWMNLQESKSTCHYDANHNLLIVVSGLKKVFLIPPSLTHLLKPVSCLAEAHNHSDLSFEEIELIASQLPTETYVVTIRQGDALFIPEGWWHMVYSTAATHAVNVWYKSNLYSVISVNNMMLPYIIRSAVNTYVSEDVKKAEFEFGKTNLCVPKHDDDLLIMVREAINQDSISEENILSSYYSPLISANLTALRAVWISFAQQHPIEWVKYLRCITPDAAFRLLEAWDVLCTQAEVGDVFERLFAPCGDMVSEGWKVFQDAVVVEVNESGLICRRLSTHQMVIDCPKLAVDKAEETRQDECFRLSSQGKPVIALKIGNKTQGALLKARLIATGYNFISVDQRGSIQTAGPVLPDLSSKIVQNYVLELLFSQDFHAFVDDMESLLSSWKDKINFN
eukprot:gene37685-45782_t